MRKLLLIIAFFLFTFGSYAQVPDTLAAKKVLGSMMWVSYNGVTWDTLGIYPDSIPMLYSSSGKILVDTLVFRKDSSRIYTFSDAVKISGDTMTGSLTMIGSSKVLHTDSAFLITDNDGQGLVIYRDSITCAGDFTIFPSNLLTISGYLRNLNYVAQYHRIDSINSPRSDEWIDVKYDTLIASESTYGYTFNSDSTGFLTQFAGITRVQGCMHYLWNGGSASCALFTRVLIDGDEARCLQTNVQHTRNTGDEGSCLFVGTIVHEAGKEIVLQYRVSNANMDFEGNSVFDNPVSVSINFERISD